MGKRLIDGVDQEQMLRNAYRLVRRRRDFRGDPLWFFVKEITAHGSTVSANICRELGWNPNAKIGSDLPARLPRPGEGCTHPALLCDVWCTTCGAVVMPALTEK